jgi:hypothetical protein
MLKTVSSITNAIGALNYKGTWNASTNTPTLADGTGAKGDYYVVSTAGTQTFGGVQLFFGLGDWIVYNGSVWQRVEGGSDGNFANVTLTSTDAGASASPLLELYRDSASPAASDTLGEIEFNGEDSAGNKQAYGLIHASILSPTSGAEQGQIHIETATGGALTEKVIIGTTNLVVNEIGAVFNVRIEGDADANLFYTDATNDKVGIGTISPAEKLDVIGKIKLSDNVVIGTSGKGIDFAATAGTGTSELLADYEEGTWTPTVGGTSTYSIQKGSYIKVGRLVTVSFDMQIILLGTGSTVAISGLPFTVGTGTSPKFEQGIGASGYFESLATTVYSLTFYANVNGTDLYAISTSAALGSTTANVNPAIYGNSTRVQGTVTYMATA